MRIYDPSTPVTAFSRVPVLRIPPQGRARKVARTMSVGLHDMDIVTVGLNHHTAPIALRERLAFRENTLPEATAQLCRQSGSSEALILSTCNRTEVYVVAAVAQQAYEGVVGFLEEYHKLTRRDFEPHLYNLAGGDAVRHLFRVSTSLDSQVVGENQILGQVRRAYAAARQAASVKRVLGVTFDEALRVGKQARSQTQIGCGAVSLGSAAVELARKIFGDINSRQVFIIGAGEIAEMAVRALAERGVRGIIVTNRTWEKAQALAARFGGRAILFSEFRQAAQEADIIISSASAPHFLFTQDDVRRLMKERRQRPLFCIDLGLPRTIDPAANSLDNMYLFNLDDLRKVTDGNQEERQREAYKVEQMIDARLGALMKRIARLCGERDA